MILSSTIHERASSIDLRQLYLVLLQRADGFHEIKFRGTKLITRKTLALVRFAICDDYMAGPCHRPKVVDRDMLVSDSLIQKSLNNKFVIRFQLNLRGGRDVLSGP
jgi:hypothetical protein